MNSVTRRRRTHAPVAIVLGTPSDPPVDPEDPGDDLPVIDIPQPEEQPADDLPVAEKPARTKKIKQ